MIWYVQPAEEKIARRCDRYFLIGYNARQSKLFQFVAEGRIKKKHGFKFQIDFVTGCSRMGCTLTFCKSMSFVIRVSMSH